MFHPVLPGRETATGVICYSFLIENNATSQRVVSDLGIRNDVKYLAPVVAAQAKQFVIRVEKDVATQLKEGGVALESKNAIIWRDRKVTEVSFDGTTVDIVGFKVLDYFGDRSFYLLDVPGHTPGHMAALARVTPTTFILLGADTCHHPGQLRPSPNLNHTFPCPGALLSAPISKADFYHDGESTNLADRTRPFLTIPPAGVPSVHSDPVQAEASIGKLAAHFDAHPGVFVMIAHDTSLGNIVELFPKTLNAWKKMGWKELGTWAFLEEGNPAFIFNAKSATA